MNIMRDSILQRNIVTTKQLQQWLFKRHGICLSSNGSTTASRGLLVKFREYGEDTWAVANSCTRSRMRTNTNNQNSSTNKLKLFRNITEVITVANMSMTSMPVRAISSTSRPRMRKYENNLNSTLARLPLKKPNYKSKLRAQNSMSLHLIYIIWHLPRQFPACIIHHIVNSNHKLSMSISRLI